MPELPEVEYAARQLRRWMRGGTIEQATVPSTRIVRGGSPRAIVDALEGAKVRTVERHGKWLRFTFDREVRAFNHFGMSGRWLKRTTDAPAERFERLRFDVKKGKRVISARYVDPRMLGHFVVAEEDIRSWTSLGPDPLVDGIDVAALAIKLRRRKQSIKEAIMDQKVLAGVGNIQATEALFRARLDPRKRSHTLDDKQIATLVKAIHWTIDRTIALETGPEISYVEDANAPNPFIVYGRGGDACPRCGTALVRVLLGGRATVFCRSCQRS